MSPLLLRASSARCCAATSFPASAPAQKRWPPSSDSQLPIPARPFSGTASPSPSGLLAKLSFPLPAPAAGRLIDSVPAVPINHTERSVWEREGKRWPCLGAPRFHSLRRGAPTRLLWNLLEQQQQPTISLSLSALSRPLLSPLPSILPSFLPSS